MKCQLCGKKLKDGEKVIRLETFNVTRRGSSLAGGNDSRAPAIHFAHVRDSFKAFADAERRRAELDSIVDLDSREMQG